MKSNAAEKRPYRQTARAAAAEATRERILDAYMARAETEWFEEIRLEDVAREAGVTVQTVIRRFGGKDGLLDATKERMNDEISNFRTVAAGDIEGCIRLVIEDYETRGEMMLRSVAQEDRHPAVMRMTDQGRNFHRGWVQHVFSPWLAPLAPEDARRRLDALVIATDLYIWKLIRRDMKRPVSELEAHMERMIHAALDQPLPAQEPRNDED